VRSKRPQTAASTSAQDEKKRQEREALMRKLKKQTEKTKERKQVKKEKGAPVMIDTGAKKSAGFDFESLD